MKAFPGGGRESILMQDGADVEVMLEGWFTPTTCSWGITSAMGELSGSPAEDAPTGAPWGTGCGLVTMVELSSVGKLGSGAGSGTAGPAGAVADEA